MKLSSAGTMLAIAIMAALLCGAGAAAQTTIQCPFTAGPPTLPKTFNNSGAIDVQISADCAAWQHFIYLNWQAAPQGQQIPDPTVPWTQFGSLAAGSTTVWQTYQPSITFFTPNDGPRKWPPPLVLKAISKFGEITISGIDQASGPVWLTGQNRFLTYYDVRMSPSEVAFASTTQTGPLNTSSAQYACATTLPAGKNGGFRLPMGYGNDTDCLGNPATYADDTGTFEIKAAWLILDAKDPNLSRYLTTTATITDPYGKTTTQTVGLTGLHIIRRFPNASQMLWATFEQVDNSPDYNLSTSTASDPRPATGAPRNARSSYQYYSASCNPSTDPYKCVVNSAPQPPCSAGKTSACTPYDAPQQIGRTTPLDFHANGINQWIWSQMPANSVFQYYRLIDVQWPGNPAPQLLSGAVVPGVNGTTVPTNMVPNLYANDPQTRVIANTTMESYVQAGSPQSAGGPLTCMDCHAYAPISSNSSATATLNGVHKRFINRKAAALFGKPSTPAGSGLPADDYLASYSFIFLNETIKP